MDARSDYIFIGGCARSGTTALCALMNAHEDVLIGHERYFFLWRQRAVGPEHMTLERFMALDEGDTHPAVRSQFDVVPSAKRTRTDLRLGDKYPELFMVYDHVWRTFPNARVLYIVRDPRYVALSFQKRADDPADTFNRSGRRAVREWNESVRTTLEAIDAGRPISVVSYDRIFSSVEAARTLFAAFDLDPDAVDQAFLASLVRDPSRRKPLPPHLLSRDGRLRSYVELMADWKAYRTLTQDHCLLSDEHRMPGRRPAAPAPASPLEREYP